MVNNREYFTRESSVPDSKLLYDHCSLNYFVESDSASPNVLIFADYEIELLKPQVSTSPTSVGATFVAQWTGVATSTDSATLDTMIGLKEGTSGKVQVSKTGKYFITVSTTRDNTTASGVILTAFGVNFGEAYSSSNYSMFTAARIVTLTAGVDYTAASYSVTLGGANSTTAVQLTFVE